MGEAKRRGTFEQRVIESMRKRAAQEAFVPAINAARRDPRWRTAQGNRARRELVLEHAEKLGIIRPAQEKSDVTA